MWYVYSMGKFEIEIRGPLDPKQREGLRTFFVKVDPLSQSKSVFVPTNFARNFIFVLKEDIT